MIHILVGGDSKNKDIYIKELTKNNEVFFVKEDEMDRELIMSYCYNVDLFNKPLAIIIENFLNDEAVGLKTDDFDFLNKSATLFIFKEDKLLKSFQDKYKKHSEIKIFDKKAFFVKEKFNIFQITDAFANKDKIGAWTLYNEALREGIEPEAISGVLFWKIKTMILSNLDSNTKKELKRQSSNIISLYHRAHRGECDLAIGLEQFILSSLSSK